MTEKAKRASLNKVQQRLPMRSKTRQCISGTLIARKLSRKRPGKVRYHTISFALTIALSEAPRLTRRPSGEENRTAPTLMSGQASKSNKIQILTTIFRVIIIKDLCLIRSSRRQPVLRPTSRRSQAFLSNTFFKNIMHRIRHWDPIVPLSTSMGQPSSQISSSRSTTEVAESSIHKERI